MNAAVTSPGPLNVTPAAADTPVDLTGWHIPEHFLIECRALTSAFVSERAGRPSCVIGMTAARAGAGVTTLAWCVARYLAQGTGESVVLVRVGPPSGADTAGAGSGLTSHPADGVRQTTEPGLAYLRTGPGDVAPGERVSSLVAHLRSRYAYVILDLPSVLAPAFSEAVVQLSDAAVLIVEPDADSVDVVQKTSTILRSMTKLLGVVFNRVETA